MDRSPAATTTPPSQATPPATPPSESPKPAGDQSLLNQTDDKTAAPQGAPEKYEFKAPEGKAFDPEALAAVEPIFKELGLSQEAAQKIVDAQATRETALMSKAGEAYKEMNEKWATEVKTEFGSKLPEVRATIGQALAGSGLTEGQIATFKEAMNTTGAGNHPGFVRMFYALAKQVTEGKPVSPNGVSPEGQRAPGQQAPSLSKAMYPHLN